MDSMSTSKTVYRVRIAHVHTLKDGWRLSETTIEAYGPEMDYHETRRHAESAYAVGTEEAVRRNRLEREIHRGVVGASKI